MTDWHQWHEQYADPNSSLSRRLGIVQQLLVRLLDELDAGHRILSLCAGDGRDVIPVVAERPAERRPDLVLVELDPQLAATARARAAAVGVDATVVVGDAGHSSTWRGHLPADLLLLCGIFGNLDDEDIEETIFSAPAMLTPTGAVVWTRGAFHDRDLRPQVRRWFEEAGFREISYQAEPGGYGVGVNRMSEAMPARPLPDQLFVFNR